MTGTEVAVPEGDDATLSVKEAWWRARNNVGRCVATSRRTLERCKSSALLGSTVCRHHGGAAGQVRRKAQERVLLASEDAVDKILELMNDSTVPAAVRLAAARDLLDRANIAGKTQVEVDIKAPWEGLVEGILVSESDIVDAEIVDDEVIEGYNANAIVEPSGVDEQEEYDRLIDDQRPDATIIDLNPPLPSHLRGKGERT